MEQETNTRVRMNVSINSKGLYQFDVTSESDNVEKAQENLSQAIDKLRETMTSKGIIEVGKEVEKK